MRYLGIDFGSKKIGLALSNEEGAMAFPLCVTKVSPDLSERVGMLAREHGAAGIVIGESRNYQGVENPIMRKISAFKDELERETGLPVYLEQEFLTSRQAERAEGKTPHTDASAAALILQSFLDKSKND